MRLDAGETEPLKLGSGRAHVGFVFGLLGPGIANQDAVVDVGQIDHDVLRGSRLQADEIARGAHGNFSMRHEHKVTFLHRNSLRHNRCGRDKAVVRLAQAVGGHSDNMKFYNDLNGPKTLNVRTAFENTTVFRDFQAEYRWATATKWPPSASVGIGGCMSPQPTQDG